MTGCRVADFLGHMRCYHYKEYFLILSKKINNNNNNNKKESICEYSRICLVLEGKLSIWHVPPLGVCQESMVNW